MMGVLEALNGVLLFGLTTAFLFAMIQEVLGIRSRQGRHATPAMSAQDRNDTLRAK